MLDDAGGRCSFVAGLSGCTSYWSHQIMPKTKAEHVERPWRFYLNDEGAALVHLLRSLNDTDFKKYCPDIVNHHSCTGVDDLMLSMFRALLGRIEQVGDVPAEGTPASRLCAAFRLAPKIGRPKREAAINEAASEKAAVLIQEWRRKQLNARARQQYRAQPVGLEAGCHVGGFTTRGTRVEPVKSAAIVEVRRPTLTPCAPALLLSPPLSARVLLLTPACPGRRPSSLVGWRRRAAASAARRSSSTRNLRSRCH